MVSMTLAQAMTGFDLACRARPLSENTIKDYFRTLRKFQAYVQDDLTISEIKPAQVQEFLASQKISSKSLLIYYIGLSAFWTWCVSEGITKKHIIRAIKPPRPEQRAIVPLTEQEIRSIMEAVKRSRRYVNNLTGQTLSSYNPSSVRNQAIILLLLDTGLRASELCSLTIQSVNIQNRTLTVMGKGRKERHIPFSARTGKAIFRYVSSRTDVLDTDPLFLAGGKYPLTRERLAHILKEIGDRAGVSGSYPHRYRHTFAINYLRNGGDVYTLQTIMGHSTMEMTRKYLALARVDLEEAHRRASPVDHWML